MTPCTNFRAVVLVWALVPLAAALTACSATTDVYVGQHDPAANAITDSAAGRTSDEPEPPAPADADSAVGNPPPPPVTVPPPPAAVDAGPADGGRDQDDDDEPVADAALDATTPGPGCDPGTADCDGDPDNGCEVVTDSDLQHCGGCDRLCHANGHDARGAQCVAGRCELQCSTDPFGDHDCDFEPDNGCETRLRTDDQNCGECGRACTCFNGQCL